jgi:hypothetical protein
MMIDIDLLKQIIRCALHVELYRSKLKLVLFGETEDDPANYEENHQTIFYLLDEQQKNTDRIIGRSNDLIKQNKIVIANLEEKLIHIERIVLSICREADGLTPEEYTKIEKLLTKVIREINNKEEESDKDMWEENLKAMWKESKEQINKGEK